MLRIERHEGARRRRNTITANRRKSLGITLPEEYNKRKDSGNEFHHDLSGDSPYEKVKGIVRKSFNANLLTMTGSQVPSIIVFSRRSNHSAFLASKRFETDHTSSPSGSSFK